MGNGNVKRKKTNIVLITLVLVSIIFGTITFSVGEVIYKNIISEKSEGDIDRGIETIYEDRNQIVQNFYSYESQEITIPSKNSYNISGIYIKTPKPSMNTIIIVHELGFNKWSNIELAFMYLENNYNVVMYNQRGVGSTGGKTKSFGFYEKDDLAAVVDYIKKKYPGKQMGIHGLGVGAATVTLYSATKGTDRKIDFIILESPYDTIKKVIQKEVEKMNTPKFLINLAVWMNDKYLEAMQGYGHEDLSPKDVVKNSNVPMLIIHGDADEIYPIEMGVDIYNNKQKGYKDLWIMEGVNHLEGFWVNQKHYENKIMEFIETSTYMN